MSDPALQAWYSTIWPPPAQTTSWESGGAQSHQSNSCAQRKELQESLVGGRSRERGGSSMVSIAPGRGRSKAAAGRRRQLGGGGSWAVAAGPTSVAQMQSALVRGHAVCLP